MITKISRYFDAWWTPGWTSQNESYIQVPPNNFSAAGFPSNLVYITVVGSFFDTTANPVSGYFTFWPSSPLTFTESTGITYMPQRYAGINESLLGMNQMGDGKIYLQYGNLMVDLLATDQANMQPANFRYHVRENFYKGKQYDIVVPSTDTTSSVDIHNLIVPGTVRDLDDFDDHRWETVCIPLISTQYLLANVSENLPPNVTMPDPALYTVSFAFLPGLNTPTNSTTWTAGSWATNTEPFIAQILLGPTNGGLVLTAGTYRVWIQIAGPSPQNPIFSVGYLDTF